MGCIKVFVLSRLSLDAKGKVVNTNVGATFNIFEAEAHKATGVESDFDTFAVTNWREDAEQSELIASMRDFREMVKSMQNEALK